MKVRPDDSYMPLYIACVCYMWEGANGDKMFHSRWMRYKIFSSLLSLVMHTCPGKSEALIGFKDTTFVIREANTLLTEL